MVRSSSEVRVRYAETDRMGFAYHAHFLAWFEIARTQLLREHGLPYAGLEAAGWFLPVLEAQVRYLRPARYDDVLAVSATMAARPTVRIPIAYEVRRGPDLLATGSTLHAFIDREGRPTRPPPAFVERMSALFPPSAPAPAD